MLWTGSRKKTIGNLIACRIVIHDSKDIFYGRKQIKMKKNIVLTLCAIAIALMCFCGIAAAREPDYPFNPGMSELFSFEDIKGAADAVMAKFSEFEGCELYLLEYAGDVRSLSELEYVKANYDVPCDECMVFMSAFRSPEKATMAWAADEDYCWSWTVIRAKDGEWVLNNWGWAEPFLKSDQYSVYDLNGASENIHADIQQMEGVKLLNISYTDDKLSAANLDYINSLDKGKFDECAVFEAWLMSPKEAFGAWEPDTLYVWRWFMGRSDKGYWETVTYGAG